MDNKLIPLEVKRRQTPARLIKSLTTLVVSSFDNTGVKKLTPEDANLIASIIYTGVVRYNNANGYKLNDKDLIRIQKRLANLDVFIFDEERKASEKQVEKRSKKLGRKINKTNKKGFLLPLTSGLVLKKKDYLDYKANKGAQSYIRTITHEGFHYLTNETEREVGLERVIAEGSDESFIIKTFTGGKLSNIIPDQKGNGLVHYNFYSRTRYSPAVSILNMLGIMVNINPEVSELKLNKKFTDAVKEKYGKAFYKQLIKRSEYLLGKKYEKMKNEPRYIKYLQGFVLRTIGNDIVENVENPEDAVKRLQAFQRAEAWSARIILKKKDPQTKQMKYVVNRDFEYIYRRTFVRTLEKLRQKGYTDLSKVEACTYRATEFAPLRKLHFDSKPAGREGLVKYIEDAKIFYAAYYKETDMGKIFEASQIDLYNRIKNTKKEVEDKLTAQPQVRVVAAPKTPQNVQQIPKQVQPKTQQPVQQPKESPQHAKVTPIPEKPNGNDDGPIFGDF